MNSAYLIKRIIGSLGTLLVAISLVFLVVHLVPGDPVATMLGDRYTEQAAAALREQLGLDQPLWKQYVAFIAGIFTGDLGTSLVTRTAVLGEVVGGFGLTIQLALAGSLVSILIGLFAGVFAAMRRGGLLDTLVMTGAMLGVSMPSFWLGLLLMIAFSVKIPIFPLLGAGDSSNIGVVLLHLVLPAVTLGLRGAGLIARVTRSTFLETINEDFIRTARAKGLSERTVLFKHGLRNALLPVVTIAGLELGRMMGGTTVVETIFSRPGMGTLLVNGVLNRDYPVIQGAFLAFLLAMISVNLIVDVLYTRLDPRIVYK